MQTRKPHFASHACPSTPSVNPLQTKVVAIRYRVHGTARTRASRHVHALPRCMIWPARVARSTRTAHVQAARYATTAMATQGASSGRPMRPAANAVAGEVRGDGPHRHVHTSPAPPGGTWAACSPHAARSAANGMRASSMRTHRTLLRASAALSAGAWHAGQPLGPAAAAADLPAPGRRPPDRRVRRGGRPFGPHHSLPPGQSRWVQVAAQLGLGKWPLQVWGCCRAGQAPAPPLSRRVKMLNDPWVGSCCGSYNHDLAAGP